MADISEWSPVDESNNQPPPNGFPEGMAPSGLNNGSRAVMGAVRRFYDQTIDGSLELPYLKLSGGILSGILSAPEYRLDGVLFAARSAPNNWHAIYDADGFDAALILGGAAAGYANYYRAEHHFIQSNSGAAAYATIDAAGVSTGNLVAANAITAGGNVTAGGQMQAALLYSTGNITAAGTVTGATVTGASLSSSGNLFIAGNGEVNGTLAVGGTVFATGFTDTDGFALVAELKALIARVEALENKTP